MHKSRREFLRTGSLAVVTVTVPTWVWGCSSQQPAPATPPDSQPEPTPVEEPPPAAQVERNEEWETKATALEGGGTLSPTNEGKWAGKAGSHVPVATFNAGAGTVTIVTNHGMAADHYITVHYLKNQDGVVIGWKEFSGADEKAESTFPLPEGTTTITAYSHCNKHDHWVAEVAQVQA